VPGRPYFNDLSPIVHTVWLVRRLVRRPPPGLYAHQEEGINQRQDPKTSCAAERAAFRDRGQVLPPAADNHPWLQHALRRSEALTRPGAENITTIVVFEHPCARRWASRRRWRRACSYARSARRPFSMFWLSGDGARRRQLPTPCSGCECARRNLAL